MKLCHFMSKNYENLPFFEQLLCHIFKNFIILLLLHFILDFKGWEKKESIEPTKSNVLGSEIIECSSTVLWFLYKLMYIIIWIHWRWKQCLMVLNFGSFVRTNLKKFCNLNFLLRGSALNKVQFSKKYTLCHLKLSHMENFEILRFQIKRTTHRAHSN